MKRIRVFLRRAAAMALILAVMSPYAPGSSGKIAKTIAEAAEISDHTSDVKQHRIANGFKAVPSVRIYYEEGKYRTLDGTYPYLIKSTKNKAKTAADGKWSAWYDKTNGTLHLKDYNCGTIVPYYSCGKTDHASDDTSSCYFFDIVVESDSTIYAMPQVRWDRDYNSSRPKHKEGIGIDYTGFQTYGNWASTHNLLQSGRIIMKNGANLQIQLDKNDLQECSYSAGIESVGGQELEITTEGTGSSMFAIRAWGKKGDAIGTVYGIKDVESTYYGNNGTYVTGNASLNMELESDSAVHGINGENDVIFDTGGDIRFYLRAFSLYAYAIRTNGDVTVRDAKTINLDEDTWSGAYSFVSNGGEVVIEAPYETTVNEKELKARINRTMRRTDGKELKVIRFVDVSDKGSISIMRPESEVQVPSLQSASPGFTFISYGYRVYRNGNWDEVYGGDFNTGENYAFQLKLKVDDAYTVASPTVTWVEKNTGKSFAMQVISLKNHKDQNEAAGYYKELTVRYETGVIDTAITGVRLTSLETAALGARKPDVGDFDMEVRYGTEWAYAGNQIRSAEFKDRGLKLTGITWTATGDDKDKDILSDASGNTYISDTFRCHKYKLTADFTVDLHHSLSSEAGRKFYIDDKEATLETRTIHPEKFSISIDVELPYSVVSSGLQTKNNDNARFVCVPADLSVYPGIYSLNAEEGQQVKIYGEDLKNILVDITRGAAPEGYNAPLQPQTTFAMPQGDVYLLPNPKVFIGNEAEGGYQDRPNVEYETIGTNARSYIIAGQEGTVFTDEYQDAVQAVYLRKFTSYETATPFDQTELLIADSAQRTVWWSKTGNKALKNWDGRLLVKSVNSSNVTGTYVPAGQYQYVAAVERYGDTYYAYSDPFEVVYSTDLGTRTTVSQAPQNDISTADATKTYDAEPYDPLPDPAICGYSDVTDTYVASLSAEELKALASGYFNINTNDIYASIRSQFLSCVGSGKTDVGTYVIFVRPDGTHKWADGSTEARIYVYKITPLTVEVRPKEPGYYDNDHYEPYNQKYYDEQEPPFEEEYWYKAGDVDTQLTAGSNRTLYDAFMMEKKGRISREKGEDTGSYAFTGDRLSLIDGKKDFNIVFANPNGYQFAIKKTRGLWSTGRIVYLKSGTYHLTYDMAYGMPSGFTITGCRLASNSPNPDVRNNAVLNNYALSQDGTLAIDAVISDETGWIRIDVVCSSDQYEDVTNYVVLCGTAKTVHDLTVTPEDKVYDGNRVKAPKVEGAPDWDLENHYGTRSERFNGRIRGTYKTYQVYSQDYAPNKAGKYNYSITYEDDNDIYYGSCTLVISPADISNAEVVKASGTYTEKLLPGELEEQAPDTWEVKIKASDIQTVNPLADFYADTGIESSRYAGTYPMIIYGSANYTGSAEGTWTLKKADPCVDSTTRDKDNNIVAENYCLSHFELDGFNQSQAKSVQYTGKQVSFTDIGGVLPTVRTSRKHINTSSETYRTNKVPTEDSYYFEGMGEVIATYRKQGEDPSEATPVAPSECGTYTVSFGVKPGRNYNGANHLLDIGTLTINKATHPNVNKTVYVLPGMEGQIDLSDAVAENGTLGFYYSGPSKIASIYGTAGNVVASHEDVWVEGNTLFFKTNSEDDFTERATRVLLYVRDKSQKMNCNEYNVNILLKGTDQPAMTRPGLKFSQSSVTKVCSDERVSIPIEGLLRGDVVTFAAAKESTEDLVYSENYPELDLDPATGEITPKTTGNYRIRATVKANGVYKEQTVYCKLRVKKADPPVESAELDLYHYYGDTAFSVPVFDSLPAGAGVRSYRLYRCQAPEGITVTPVYDEESGSFKADIQGATAADVTDPTRNTIEIIFLAETDFYYNTGSVIRIHLTGKETHVLFITETGAPESIGMSTGSPVVTGLPDGVASTDPKVTITYIGTVEDGGRVYTETTEIPTEAGNYFAIVRYETEDGVYEGVKPFTIQQLALSAVTDLTIVPGRFKEDGSVEQAGTGVLTYTGSLQTLPVFRVTCKNGGVLRDITDAVEILGNTATDVGSYQMSVRGTGNVSGSVSNVYEWSIKKADREGAVITTRERCGDTMELDLAPFIPDPADGAVFGGVSLGTVTDNEKVLDVDSGTGKPNVYLDKNSGKLCATINSDMSKAGKSVDIPVLVTNRKNYNDHTLTVTVTASKKYPQKEFGFEKSVIEKYDTDEGFVITAPGAVEGSTVTYVSSAPEIASVDPDTGEVILHKDGEAIITATASETTTFEETNASVKLRVKIQPYSRSQKNFAFGTGSLEKHMGDADFTLTASGAETGSTVSYTSSNEAVAVIDKNTGKVHLVSPGETILTARASRSDIYAAEEKEIVLKVLEASETIDSGDDIGSDGGDDNGDDTGDDPGTDIKPSPVKVTGLTINKTSLTVLVGSSASLTATVTPDNATDKNIVWTSSDSKIASVDTTGKVTGIAKGKVTITAGIGEYQAKCSVLVIEEGTDTSKITEDTAYSSEEDKPRKAETLTKTPIAVTVGEVSVQTPVKYEDAVVYTGRKIDPEKDLGASIDISAIEGTYKLKTGRTDKLSDLIRVSYVSSGKAEGTRTFYGKLTVTKTAKKALSKSELKKLKKLVKNLNDKLKRTKCSYTIYKRSLTDGMLSTSVAKKNGKIKQKKGKISKVKSVKLTYTTVENGEEIDKTITLKNGKDCKISLVDANTGLVRVEAKKNTSFTGSVTLYVN